MSVERMALVLNHSRARGTDKVVLIGIANHDGDGGAWPSLATLARYANVDERTVRRSIASLVALGELAVDVNAGGTGNTRGDRRPNLYRVLVRPYGGTRTSARDEVSGGTPTSERGDAHVTHGGTPTSPEPSYEPSTEPPTPLTPQPLVDVFAAAEARDADAARFDEFWDTYPRKAGKRAARSAYARAVARLGHVHGIDHAHRLIIEGARRYATDPNREDTYTAHPSTWLNQDRWDDEPLPGRGGGRVSGTALYLDAAAEFAGWDTTPAAIEA